MIYAIAHAVRLAFPAPVWEQHCELRLAPRASEHQRVVAVTLELEPPAEPRAHVDGFGNPVHAFDLLAPHDAIVARIRARVETTLANPFDYPLVPPAAERAWLADALRSEPRLWDYTLHRSAATPDFAALGLACPPRDPARPLLDALRAVLDWTDEQLAVAPGFALAATPLADALRAGHGNGQDLTHLLISVARAWGAPARYAMGYCDPDNDEDEDAPTTLHAWAEILVPGAGWRGLDPTARLVTNDTYVTVALGRDAFDCPPIRSHAKGAADAAATTTTLEVTRDQ